MIFTHLLLIILPVLFIGIPLYFILNNNDEPYVSKLPNWKPSSSSQDSY